LREIVILFVLSNLSSAGSPAWSIRRPLPYSGPLCTLPATDDAILKSHRERRLP